MFMAGAALVRMFGFLIFKYKQHERAAVDANLLPRYPGTISVLIPVFNEAENVRATILSVLNNSRQPDEIIVIDDGSTDNTLAHARSIEAQFPGRVRTITKANGGKSSALNRGITESTGDIIIAIDGDTVLHPDCIDAASRPFVHDRVGAVAGKILPACTDTLMEKYQYLEYIVGQNIDKQFISSLGSVHIVPGAVGAWRRSALLAVGGYSGDTLVEDQDLTLALLGKNYGIVYSPSAIAYTEVPTTLRSLYLQRFRWTYGTFQCLYKYRAYLFGDAALRLGWISLPYSFIFNIVMPVVALALNLAVIFGVIVGVVHPGFLMLVVFTLLDTLYAYVALLEEVPGRRLFAALVPFQRFVYLLAYSIIIFLVVVKILDGSPTRWNKTARNGAAELFFHKKLVRSAGTPQS
jgi:cellulose synthase/poly-beta-1,6-N-acetylglucosamine synthase-like glycosyltransferase